MQMVKRRSEQGAVKKSEIDQKTIDDLADRLADKPYGQEPSVQNVDDTNSEELERVTITIPQNMRYALEDLAIQRKRSKQKGASVSAIVREALGNFISHTS